MNSGVWREMMHHPEIREILDHREFRALTNFNHHGRGSRYAHCVDVAAMVYLLARRKNLDVVSAARGALLHDFFFYHRRDEGPRLHNFRHPAIALSHARRHFSLNPIEEDAILRHMWPLTPIPPRYPESVLVSLADKIVAVNDFSRRFRHVRTLRLRARRARA